MNLNRPASNKLSKQSTLIGSVRVGVLIVSATVLVGNAFAQSNTLPATGNVGIGTTSPQYPLDVNGAIRATGSGGYLFNSNNYVYFKEGYGPLIGLGGSGVPFGASFINSNGTNVMYVRSDGNVGIGTTSPGSPLTVNAASGSGININGVPDNSAAQALSIVSATGKGMWFVPSLGGGSYNGLVQQNDQGLFFTAGASGTGNLVIAPWNGLGGIRMTSAGNVGIGTSSPSAPLEVKGSVKLTAGSGASVTYQDGTVQSTAWNGVLQGGDYAESVDVSGDRDQYEPGDVLVIDPSSKGRFLKSSEPYSTAVMGVFSTRPGVVGRRQKTDRSHMKDEVPLAMVGVVPTKVTAESGAIKAGDLLVTSSRPGYAMKGTDRSLLTGAIIGKALEPLDAGTGVIEVAVSIQ